MRMPEFSQAELSEWMLKLAQESLKCQEIYFEAIGKVIEAYHDPNGDKHFYAIQNDHKQTVQAKHDQMQAIKRLMPVRMEVYFTHLLREIEDRRKSNDRNPSNS